MRKNGFTIIEIMVVILVVALALTGLIGLYSLSLKAMTQSKLRTQALNLAAEGMEIARGVRDESWNNIASLNMGANYYPTKVGVPAKWALGAGIETISTFSRRLVFEDAYRDANANLVSSGGSLDPNTKKVTVTVAWSNQSVVLSTYLTNWK